jgi:hypothetical protein
MAGLFHHLHHMIEADQTTAIGQQGVFGAGQGLVQELLCTTKLPVRGIRSCR